MLSEDKTLQRIKASEAFMLALVMYIIERQIIDTDGLTILLQKVIDTCQQNSDIRWQLREMLAEVRWLSWPLPR